jgi:hypothetical protein
MIFISTKSKSVESISLLNLEKYGSDRTKLTPEVSIQVWMFFCFANSKNSIKKSSCIKGSPPLTVMPPSEPQ